MKTVDLFPLNVHLFILPLCTLYIKCCVWFHSSNSCHNDILTFCLAMKFDIFSVEKSRSLIPYLCSYKTGSLL